MKRLFFGLAVLLATPFSFGQGTIYFNTRVVGIVDAPVTLATGASPGPDYTAQLFEVGPGGSLSPLFPATTFRSGSAVNQKYVNAIDAVVVPDVAPGGSVKVIMAAWPTSLGSFEAAKASRFDLAISVPVTVDSLGGGVLPPANLTGQLGSLQGFAFPVPEPSAIVLGVLAVSAGLLRRCKK